MAKKKKGFIKSSFFLNGPAFTHPPPPLNGPAISGFFLRHPLVSPKKYFAKIVELCGSSAHQTPNS